MREKKSYIAFALTTGPHVASTWIISHGFPLGDAVPTRSTDDPLIGFELEGKFICPSTRVTSGNYFGLQPSLGPAGKGNGAGWRRLVMDILYYGIVSWPDEILLAWNAFWGAGFRRTEGSTVKLFFVPLIWRLVELHLSVGSNGLRFDSYDQLFLTWEFSSSLAYASSTWL